jgi:hypothetical protein
MGYSLDSRLGPHYAFAGSFQPVANASVVTTVSAGSSVPVKFSLGGNYGLNVFAAGYPKAIAMSCGADPLSTPSNRP